MILRSDLVDWLRCHIADAARADDLARTYSFRHHSIHERALVKASVNDSWFEWAINFSNHAGRPLLQVPLSRKVAPARPLVGNPGSGTVAVNLEFILYPHAQRQGVGAAVYDSEAKLYARWKVAEVQLEATEDGLVVWIKKGFLPQNPGLVAQKFAAWAKTNGYPPEPPERPVDYPKPFLLSLKWLPLYKEV
jgi:GNAT superfamily N-acetyltransferase